MITPQPRAVCAPPHLELHPAPARYLQLYHVHVQLTLVTQILTSASSTGNWITPDFGCACGNTLQTSSTCPARIKNLHPQYCDQAVLCSCWSPQIERHIKAALRRQEALSLDTGISWVRAHIGIKATS